MVHTSPDKKRDPISKITNTKRAGDMTQVVEYLPGKHKALSSNKQKNKEIIFFLNPALKNKKYPEIAAVIVY
jgi:hypothetical protein